MTETETRIFELFQTLGPSEKRALVEKLSEAAASQFFYDRLSPDQRMKLDDGVAQANAGDVMSAVEVFDRLADRFGFSKE